jgi:uncharacterized protein (UPF0303 family)
LAQLLAEEEELHFSKFDNFTAFELGQFAVRRATDQQLAIAILIRRNGQRIFQASLPGTSPDNDYWLDKKSRLTDRLNHSSYFLKVLADSKSTTVEEMYCLESGRYAAYGGSFPISLLHTGVIGTFAISGLDQAEDHEFAVESLRCYLGQLQKKTDANVD